MVVVGTVKRGGEAQGTVRHWVVEKDWWVRRLKRVT